MHLSKTIVFITGAFVSHKGWDAWKNYYESKGFTCLAPPWPFKDASPQELRNRQPNDKDLAGLRFKELVNHYEGIVSKLPEKPIVVGHSLGGLIVQILVNRELVSAGVAIHTVPPKGVTSFEWSFIKSIWKPLGYFTSVKKTHLMSLSEWKFAFTNGMSAEEQADSYEKNTIPESKLVLRDTLTAAAKIDFLKTHPPLLFVSGTADNIMPASLNYHNYLRYDRNHSVTDYKEFKGKNHFVLGLPSWHEEADYILHWFEILSYDIKH
jgi:pimeloyl-ACP methyl ester carboxylesterase